MRIIERNLFAKIFKWIETPEIIVVLGSRQVGKTTLLNLLIEKIQSPNKFYIDLEDLKLLDICNSGVTSFINYVSLQGFSIESKLYIAIDEIQYLENPSNFLKILHDHYPNIKLIVTGSSTLEIKKKFKDSLTGRKIIFELNSFSFFEFLLLTNPKFSKIKSQIGNISDILKHKFNPDLNLFEKDFYDSIIKYIVYGGYPRILHEDNHERKIILIKEIHNSYVRKDIKNMAQINDLTSFNNIIKVTASQIGGQLNYNELSNTIGINLLTLKKHLFLLNNTFIISLCQPHFVNKRKEISKMPKVYYQDTGLRNTILNYFPDTFAGTEWGNLIENFIYNELRRHFVPNESLFYWRTLAGAEVDFVIIPEYSKLIPIEVKATNLKTAKISRSFRSFINTYKPEMGIIFNNSYTNLIEINGCRIYFLPHFAI